MVLAGTVDPGDQPHRRLTVRRARQGPVRGPQRIAQLLLEHRQQLVGLGDAVLACRTSQLLDDLHRRGHPHVGGDQRLLQPLPGVVVDAATEQLGHATAQHGRGPRQPGAEALRKRQLRFWLRLLDLRLGRCLDVDRRHRLPTGGLPDLWHRRRLDLGRTLERLGATTPAGDEVAATEDHGDDDGSDDRDRAAITGRRGRIGEQEVEQRTDPMESWTGPSTLPVGRSDPAGAPAGAARPSPPAPRGRGSAASHPGPRRATTVVRWSPVHQPWCLNDTLTLAR